MQALEAERENSARLRNEVTALHTTIECLAKGNQNCLETISKLFMAGFGGKGEFEGEGLGEMGRYGQVGSGYLQRGGDGCGLEAL